MSTMLAVGQLARTGLRPLVHNMLKRTLVSSRPSSTLITRLATTSFKFAPILENNLAPKIGAFQPTKFYSKKKKKSCKIETCKPMGACEFLKRKRDPMTLIIDVRDRKLVCGRSVECSINIPRKGCKKLGVCEFKAALKDCGTLVIDIRPKKEAKKKPIKGAVNIPLCDLRKALKMCPDEFKCKYKRNKPDKCTKVVFVDACGQESKEACKIAKCEGIKKTYRLKGGANALKK